MPHLFWGGADCVELAARFGTPLYVLDESVIRARCAEVRRDFLDRWPSASASYAGKAFLTRTMARIVEEEGLGLDVVSLGELHTALSAGFPASRIEMHGSAKSEAELNAALDAGVGRIVVDGLMELEVLADLAAHKGRRAEILLRVTPGVVPHTHAYIATGHEGSKFGLPLDGA
ncbi:MAG: diaminopimelate decarboxylase family protein, partial [Fretibacterium sp.]